MQDIPYVVLESEMVRQERIHKRDFIEKLVLIMLLVVTNLGWLWYESQWEYTETTERVEQEIEAEGDFTVIGIGNNYGKR